MVEPRTLAIVREYDDLLAAVRARMDELELTFDLLDHRSGVQVGYSSKIISPRPSKTFGPVSWGAIMGALRLKLILVDDPDAAGNRLKKLEKRRVAKNMPAMVSIPWFFTPGDGRRLADLRLSKIPANRRSGYARKAARARWRNRGAV